MLWHYWRLLIYITLIRFFMFLCVMIHKELSYNPNSYNQPFDLFYPTLTNAPSKKYSSTSNSPIPQIIEQLSNDYDYNYTNWATLLSNANHLSFKDTTIFIPDNDAVVKPMLFHYHIASQRLTYEELLHYYVDSGARVTTLARGSNLFITVIEDGSTLAVNGVPITRPNLYEDATVCVHGIEKPLEMPSFDTPNVDATSALWFQALFAIYSYYVLNFVLYNLRVFGFWDPTWIAAVGAYYILDFTLPY